MKNNNKFIISYYYYYYYLKKNLFNLFTGEEASIWKYLRASFSFENIILHFFNSLSRTTPSSFEYEDNEDAAFCQIANSCLNSINQKSIDN